MKNLFRSLDIIRLICLVPIFIAILIEANIYGNSLTCEPSSYYFTFKNWLNIYGSIGIIYCALIIFTDILLYTINNTGCIIITKFLSTLIYQIYILAWLIVGSIAFFQNCHSDTGNTFVNQTLYLSISTGFIFMGFSIPVMVLIFFSSFVDMHS